MIAPHTTIDIRHTIGNIIIHITTITHTDTTITLSAEVLDITVHTIQFGHDKKEN
jgi:hypothetical protein